MSNALTFDDKVEFGGSEPLLLPKAAADPGTASNGDMYYNTTTNTIRAYQNGMWAPVAGGATINEFTLTPTDISNKFVTLSAVSQNPTLTLLNVIGGPLQDYGTDYTVSGSQLSWSGLGLDGVLSSGDKLIVEFS